MIHADDYLIRDKEDERALTVLVGRMSPSKALFATMCHTKDPQDLYALNRLENCLKDEGVSKVAYRSDQEPAIVALIEAAICNCGKAGTVTDAAPSILPWVSQQFEDYLRTPRQNTPSPLVWLHK